MARECMGAPEGSVPPVISWQEQDGASKTNRANDKPRSHMYYFPAIYEGIAIYTPGYRCIVCLGETRHTKVAPDPSLVVNIEYNTTKPG